MLGVTHTLETALYIKRAVLTGQRDLGACIPGADKEVIHHRQTRPLAYLFCQERRLVVAPAPKASFVEGDRDQRILG